MERKLLSGHEVAVLFGISENTLRIWRSAGKGPKYIRIGGRIRYRAADVESYIDQRTVTPILERRIA